MSDETNAGERELLLGKIKTSNERIKELEAMLADALSKREQQKPPLVRGTYCIDLDSPLADQLVLEFLEPRVLAATVRREHKMRLSWQAKCIVAQEELVDVRDDKQSLRLEWVGIGSDVPPTSLRWQLMVNGTLHVATVWKNGTWHTWDQYGTGGENDVETTVGRAKVEAIAAAIRQGYIHVVEQPEDAAKEVVGE